MARHHRFPEAPKVLSGISFQVGSWPRAQSVVSCEDLNSIVARQSAYAETRP